MAIEFTHRGRKWRADSAEEAIRLRDQLEREDFEAAGANGEGGTEELVYERSQWTTDRFYELVHNIGPLQENFLAALMNSFPFGTPVEEVCRKIKQPTLMALAGVQSGLAKQVRALGLEPSDLYSVRISWTEGDRRRFLKIDQGFRTAAIDADWPTKEILNRLKN